MFRAESRVVFSTQDFHTQFPVSKWHCIGQQHNRTDPSCHHLLDTLLTVTAYISGFAEWFVYTVVCYVALVALNAVKCKISSTMTAGCVTSRPTALTTVEVQSGPLTKLSIHVCYRQHVSESCSEFSTYCQSTHVLWLMFIHGQSVIDTYNYLRNLFMFLHVPQWRNSNNQ